MSHRSRRCTMCNVSWPLNDDYRDCPSCGQPTWRSTADPMPEDEARREKARHDFERYLERRDTEDRRMMERVEPFAFAQYLMDAAEEQIEREADKLT